MSTPMATDQRDVSRIPSSRNERSGGRNRAGLSLTPSVSPEEYAKAVPVPLVEAIPQARSNVSSIQAGTLERANEKLRRANRELEEFAYVASHDLREPLRMVNIYTQLLIQDCGSAASQQGREFAQHIQESVARMEQLIQDVLEYSQVIHLEQERAAPVPLRRSLDLAWEIFRARLDAAGAEICVDHLPVVLGDDTQLAIVFQNLISNSLKYAHPQRPLQIRVWSQKSGDVWKIILRTTGSVSSRSSRSEFSDSSSDCTAGRCPVRAWGSRFVEEFWSATVDPFAPKAGRSTEQHSSFA